MSRIRRIRIERHLRALGTTIAVLNVVVFSGCAGWTERMKFPPDVRPIREKRMQAAFDSFEENRNSAQYRAARTFFRQGNYNVCHSQLDSLLSRCPDHRAANLLMIDLLLEERKCDEALQRAQSLADTLPDDPDVAHVLAIVYDVSGDEERALETFEHAAALAINGQSSGRQRQLRTGEKAGDALTEASECFDRGEYDEAFRRIKPVLDAPSASPAAHLLAGRILTAQGDAVQAIYHYELASGHLQSVDEPEVGVASSGNARRR